MQKSGLRKVIEFLLDNLLDFATIALAVFVFIRYQVRPSAAADIAELAPWILAVLALIAVSGIWDRSRRMGRMESLLNENRDLSENNQNLIRRAINRNIRADDFLLTDRDLKEESFASARRIILTGVTLQHRTSQFTHMLEQRLRAGASVQLVLLEPSDSNLQQMVARGWGEATVDLYRTIINSTLAQLEIIARNAQSQEQLEIGFLPFYPGMAFEMIDPDEPHGTCWVTILPHKSTKPSPAFRLQASEDPHWYSFFREQFNLLWGSCRIERFPKLISQQKLDIPSPAYREKTKVTDLHDVIYGSMYQALGEGLGRIFHAQCPCVLPVCFKHPERSEYTYVAASANTADEKDRILTEPHIAGCESVLIRQVRWYRLTAERPVQSIKFGSGPRIEDFLIVAAEVYPVEDWNEHIPVTVPGNRSRAYGLAITEQKGPSSWFVSVDQHRFGFNENPGCHFVEFILEDKEQHNLSFGYEKGQWGIACAFFAF